jgi:hypothetical protein
MSSSSQADQRRALILIPKSPIATLDLTSPQHVVDFLEATRLLPDPEERYATYEAIARTTDEASNTVDEISEKTWSTMRNDTLAWSTSFSTYEQFEQTFAPLKERAESATKKRNYQAEAHRKLSLVGLQSEDWTVLVMPGASGTLVQAAGNMMMQRLAKSGRGGTRIKEITTTDYNKAAELTDEQLRDIPTYNDDDLRSHKLCRLDNGLFGVASPEEAVVFRDLPPIGIHAGHN